MQTTLLALTLLALTPRDEWSSDHPIAIGARASGTTGVYAAPGVGGHFKIRPFEWIGVETFLDNFGVVSGGVARHDHVIGFSLYVPSLIGSRRLFLSPTIGTCVDFRFVHPLESDNPATKDILFGLHGGLMAELFLRDGFSVELASVVYGYLGHDTGVERWTSSIGNDLEISWTAQLLGSLNFYF